MKALSFIKKHRTSILLILGLVIAWNQPVYSYLIKGEEVRLNTADFDGALSENDDTVQKAFDTLDDAIVGAGSGDVTGVGDCPSGACFDGTSDGGTHLQLYESSGATKIQAGDNTGAVTLTLPITTGTMALKSDLDSLICPPFVIDGNGSTIEAGASGHKVANFTGTITSWEITSSISGTTVVDVKKSTYATYPTFNSIAGTEKPTLSAGQTNTDTSLSSWTTAVIKGDRIQAVVDSADINGIVVLSIYGTKG